MKLFYKKLTETFEKEEIKDLYRTKGLTPVQFIDLYAEQDLIPEWFEVHHYPALLVSWDINYSNDTAVANIIFYICYEQLHDTSNLGTNTEMALKFLDFIELTDEILKNVISKNTGKLELVSENYKRDETVVDVYILNYQCSYSGKLNTLQYLQGNVDELNIKKGLFSKVLD